MTVINNLRLSLDELRSLALEAFKKSPETQYLGLLIVAELAVQKGRAQLTREHRDIW